MDDVLRVVAALEMFGVTIGVWAFALLFHVLSDWRESVMGRHFMAFMMTLALVLTWAWVGFVFDIPEIVQGWVRVVLYGTLALVVLRQVKILINLQTITRNTPKEETNGQST